MYLIFEPDLNSMSIVREAGSYSIVSMNDEAGENFSLRISFKALVAMMAIKREFILGVGVCQQNTFLKSLHI